MPLEPTGSVQWLRDPEDGVEKWHARVRTATGRPTVKIPGIPQDQKELAKSVAAETAKALRAQGPTSGPSESVEAYVRRWVASREGRVGAFEVTSSAGRLRNHVLPVRVRKGAVPFGQLGIADVTREDVEDVVTALDRKVASSERFAWKTASNVWAVVTKMFDDAKNAKDRSLRARADDPTTDVRGPDTGVRKAKQFLYPSEFLRLIACPEVPRPAREMYAILVYTYVRSGELAALLRSDIDLEHGVIEITKAIDRETGEVKPTKSEETRRIPIEPALAPLLRGILARREKGSRRGDFWMPPPEDRAELLREHLRVAGVTRPALFANDERRKHITLHDLRATGQTWAAVRGDDHLKIMQRAGHADAATSMLYIREADNLRVGFGDPFPALVGLDADWTPEAANVGQNSDPNGNRTQISADMQVAENAAEDVRTGAQKTDSIGAALSPGPAANPLLQAIAAAVTAGQYDLARELTRLV